VQINWKILEFNEISINESYDLFQLRSKIFVLEQNCIYLDLDGKDKEAIHILGYFKKKIIACARLIINNKKYFYIGRIAVDKNYRKKHIGEKLVKECLNQLKKKEEKKRIKISAQSHLEIFYNKLGFSKKGEEYLEDGITHIAMYYLD